jgi:excisionase family DNA binding protein
MQVNGTRMLRVKAVADMLDVSPSTIYRAIESGQLEALQMGSGHGAVRVPERAVQAFLDLCAKAAASTDQPTAEGSSVPPGGAAVSIPSGGAA